MAIEVILTEDVEKLGNAGEIVRVKNGYARNFLIPQRKALLATARRVNETEHKRRMIEEHNQKELADVRELARKIVAASLVFSRQAGEEGKLFGSVTNADIHERLQEQGCSVDRRKIALGEPIKELGEHQVELRLHREVTVPLRVTVEAAE